MEKTVESGVAQFAGYGKSKRKVLMSRKVVKEEIALTSRAGAATPSTKSG